MASREQSFTALGRCALAQRVLLKILAHARVLAIVQAQKAVEQ